MRCGELYEHDYYFDEMHSVQKVVTTLNLAGVKGMTQDSNGLIDFSECSYQHTQHGTQK